MPGKSHKPFGNYPKPQLRDKRVLTAESTSSVGQQLQVGIGHDGIGKRKWKWKGHTHTHTQWPLGTCSFCPAGRVNKAQTFIAHKLIVLSY